MTNNLWNANGYGGGCGDSDDEHHNAGVACADGPGVPLRTPVSAVFASRGTPSTRVDDATLFVHVAGDSFVFVTVAAAAAAAATAAVAAGQQRE